MLHRLRQSYETSVSPFAWKVEVGETCVGSKRRNMPKSKIEKSTDAPTLAGFVEGNTSDGARVYADHSSSYCSVARDRKSVNPSASACVRCDVNANGVESFWAMLKEAHKGTCRKMSPKHPHRYVPEFAGNNKARARDTNVQMNAKVSGMAGQRLRYRDLVR